MTFNTWLNFSKSHPSDLIRQLALDYGGGMWGTTPDDLRRGLIPWADYDQAAAIAEAEAEWAALYPGEAERVRVERVMRGGNRAHPTL